MLAARGVSLGLGKINLSDLNQLPQDRILAAQFKKSQDAKNKKPRIIIKKKADAKHFYKSRYSDLKRRRQRGTLRL
ncbi:unnamed protein product [Caenorhabditis nigoni]